MTTDPRSVAAAARAEAHAAEWHKRRRLEIVKAHPEVAKLHGRTWLTPVIHAAALATQVAVCLMAPRLHPALLLLLAWTVGATAEAIFFSACHEYSHKLVSRSERWNTAFITVSYLVSVVRHSAYFRFLHLEHHRMLGAPGMTAAAEGAPARFVDPNRVGEGRMFEDPHPPDPTFLGAVAKLVRYHVRLVRIVLWESFMLTAWRAVAHVAAAWGRRQRPNPMMAYDALCVVLKLPVLAALVAVGGPWAFIYLLGSQLAWRGFFGHPFFAVWLMMHNGREKAPREGYAPAPTGSYYAWANLLCMNLGYHVEHHDFPQVPWHHLGRVHRLAREHYQSTPQLRSALPAWAAYVSSDPNWTFGYAEPQVGPQSEPAAS